ncbi:MAG TPA: hypothetical protein DEF47_06355 [Herpetosiphon sp.]|uniref:Glycosyltransferase RgtA/B/C/D-like domain-containing protein n=1 Tax=Herpetosiphon aurantiacus (strain ATCC 23779 / DSM 785 / 114-95) TaxID=316274 RepID=A9B855_HERA2|nr:hypothetical protein [Herpetosiphon sp.]ABX05988.1 conserved hypothetical protein [Herpetosiphon aurantiacus DSM 785]HBW49506.1 hypothetical protein [Herpetosiphon sp.]
MQIDSQHLTQANQSTWQRYQTVIASLSAGVAILLALFSFGLAASFDWLVANAQPIIGFGSFVLLVIGLPGWATIRWLTPQHVLTRSERWALSWAVGIALPPILFNLFHIVGLSINRWVVVGYALLGLLLTIWPEPRSAWNTRLAQLKQIRISSHAWILLSITLVSILQRLLAVRELSVAQWNDAYHHTIITQLFLDHGGIFETWQPYADLNTFSYHYGFHANSAFLAWWSQLPATTSVLYTGQLLGIATGVMAYLLGRRLSNRPSVGLIAFGLTSFYNLMPAYYVNWSRFTQLIGQVILVGLVVIWLLVLEYPQFSWKLVGLASVLTTSLLLTHYLVTIFAVVMVGFGILALLARQPSLTNLKQISLRATAISLASALIAAPWLYTIIQSKLTAIARNYVTGYSVGYATTVATLDQIVPTYIKAPIMLLAVVGIWLACAQRAWRMLLLVVWSLGLQILAVPYVFNLPISGIISGFAVSIMLYLTLIPLAAYPLGLVLERFNQQWYVKGLALIGLYGLIVWSTPWQTAIVNEQNRLLTRADEQAMHWIRTTTESEARFLINGLFSYGDALIIADDGGMWIPFLTGRQTTIPPLTYGSEKAINPQLDREVYALYDALRTTNLETAAGLALLQQHQVDYIYTGPHMGKNAQKIQLNTQALRYRPEQFPIVYERDGVVIFAVKAQQ